MTPDQARREIKLMHWSTDPACWRNYVQDLIYGAATSPTDYARQVAKRRRGADLAKAMCWGREMGDELRRLYPEAVGIIGLARAATGEDLAGKARAERWAATTIQCAAWLPKPPGGDRQLAQAERARRSGVTDEQRQSAADALAIEIVSNAF
jgi:hypothetical protein